MFESLDERIHNDDLKEASTKERALRYAWISAVSVAAVAALFGVIHFVQ